MTREEVAEIMTYCQEHTVSYKDRLAELGIAPWRFYDAKSRYAKTTSTSRILRRRVLATGSWWDICSSASFCVNNRPQAKVQEVRYQSSNDEH